MYEISIAIEQAEHPIDEERLRSAVKAVLGGEGIQSATISMAVVNDERIHELNLRFLQHDEPTDVLSFVLNAPDEPLDGEIIVSIETAARNAGRYGWSVADELLLYVVHGALHLTGHDDRTVEDQRRMRERERHYLSCWGLVPRYDDAKQTDADRSTGQAGACPCS
jgi:probable rRNA maturation factor